MTAFHQLAVSQGSDLLFGQAPHPLATHRGLLIGGGLVYPELNFTLPPMLVESSTMDDIRSQYGDVIQHVLQRAVELEVPGLVIEFETLPPMTENPTWAGELTRILRLAMESAYQKHGLKSVLRVTPNDLREMERPPRMRGGRWLDLMWETFHRCAEEGAELLSIESVGGKEVHDHALLMGDIRACLFALCILGVRDMRFLWTEIVALCRTHKVVPAGDTACGFGNTAMVLAEQRMIPKVFAAVIRAISAVRTLVAHECGAVGPGKDCGYENPILKAITGYPMAMEGKTSSCAHFSPVGNITAATCDTWSNESVQNIPLLAGPAPVCCLEQLAYDCRLMNQARQDGLASARLYAKWMTQSDAPLDPQAFILAPENAVALGRVIVTSKSPYEAGRKVGLAAIQLLQEAHQDQRLSLAEREVSWLHRLEVDLEGLPDNEDHFINEVMESLNPNLFVPGDYGQ